MMIPRVFQGKIIIGLAGGIGSGKSYIASLFAELGCAVIDSDAAVAELYRRPAVLQTLRGWWGDEAVSPAGQVDRKAIARRVFSDPAERRRLEAYLHPLVNDLRVETMTRDLSQMPDLKAFIWDTPLLFESGLYQQCDALVFIETPIEIRAERVAKRGWNAEELARRENLQWPLDKKRLLCNDVIVNSGNGGDARGQVGQVLTRILAR
ncbi:dephospho-CoA kinase [soil metagenome]